MNIKDFSFTKKIFTLVFAVILCFSSFSAQRTEAVYPVFDSINFDVNIENMLNTAATAISTTADTVVNTAHASWSTLGKNTFDALAYTAGQIALNQLTDQTIAWIRGGFHGMPSYTVDTQAMGEELADSVTLGLVSQIKGLATCEFTGTFVDDLTDSYQLSKKKKMPITCPFPDSLTNMKFYASDVETAVNHFSWELFSMAMDDAGNPYGVQIVTANQLQANQEKAKANSDQKMSWSNGYADIVDTNNCPGMPPESADYIRDGNIVAYYDTNGDGENEGTEYDGNPDPATVQALQKAYCKTTTPGNIVSDQLSSTLRLDMDRLGFADNLNKIISALLTVAVQSAIRAVF